MPEPFVIFRSFFLFPTKLGIHTHTHTHTYIHETTVITFKDNIEKMSEVIIEIIARSTTLKAKQKEVEEEKKKHCYRVQKARKKDPSRIFLYMSGLRWTMEEFGKKFLRYCSYRRSRC